MKYRISDCTGGRGFVLLVVITILLAISILGVALSSFKAGAVTQLAKTIDQNRLAVIAQAANNEIVANIISQVNRPGSDFFREFRRPFEDFSSSDLLNPTVYPLLNPAYSLETVEQMAVESGYNVSFSYKADLIVYEKSSYRTCVGFKAYIEVISRVSLGDRSEGMVELKERRDVKLWDIRHFFDKYVLFVKNYSPDYNNTRCRIVIEGIPPDATGKGMSRVFLGTNFYTSMAEGDEGKKLWFDISDENKVMLTNLFGTTGDPRIPFPESSHEKLFWFDEKKLTEIEPENGSFQFTDFSDELAVKKVYEKFVNAAAERITPGAPPQEPEIAGKLYEKCKKANQQDSNSNSASYEVCADFLNNDEEKAKNRDYSDCVGFRKILSTCFESWNVHIGYTDAASIWSIDQCRRPNFPAPESWTLAANKDAPPTYGGLSARRDGSSGFSPYFEQYLEKIDDVVYNRERVKIGRMAKFFGSDLENPVPVIFEGDAYLRFFKIAYFDSFKKVFDFWKLTDAEIPVEPVPLSFLRPDQPENFLNRKLKTQLSSCSDLSGFMEKYLMSRAIDNIPLNCLLGNSLLTVGYDGNEKNYNPFTDGCLVKPQQKTSSGTDADAKAGRNFFRVIDYGIVSHNYINPQKLLEERLTIDDGEPVLVLDGLMFVNKGDLDLSKVKKYTGKGMIFLGTGNCILGNLIRARSVQDFSDSLRIYLHNGDFHISGASDNIDIEASLYAISFPNSSNDQTALGSLYCNGKKKVRIKGNLIVDYLFTDNGNLGVADGGELVLIHDYLINDPECTINSMNHDPYSVSISGMKTFCAMNSGQETF